MLPTILDIATLADGYRSGRFTPGRCRSEAVIARIAAWPDQAVWISRVAGCGRFARAAEALVAAGPPDADQPLWGMPFAVKDNIDCAGLPTTAACPPSPMSPSADAFVVAKLKAAGAILIGKTNLDQFATGLNGTRSPYGAPRSRVRSGAIFPAARPPARPLPSARGRSPSRSAPTRPARAASPPPSTISSA